VFDMEWMSAMGDRLPMTLVAKLIGLPDDDMLSDLAVAVNDGDVEPHVAVLMLVQLVAAGGESTAGLIGNAARLLATHPEAQAAGPIHAPILPSARGCTSASGRRWPVPRPGSR
jgi:cytochrome P450